MVRGLSESWKGAFKKCEGFSRNRRVLSKLYLQDAGAFRKFAGAFKKIIGVFRKLKEAFKTHNKM